MKRGQRKPIEPSAEFKCLFQDASDNFIRLNFEVAEQLILQAILLNPEMHRAHSLLYEIHEARGEHDKALTALFNGAHTRPRHARTWESLAQRILDRAGENNIPAVNDAVYCYSRLIQIEPENAEARFQRAALNRNLGYSGKAAMDYEYLLRLLPHDMTILRFLAEIYMELGNVDRAIDHYNVSIRNFQLTEVEKAISITWSDLNILAELYGYKGQYEEGIVKLKTLSRWLLGRRGDLLWEKFNEDDREWDLDDQPRRIQTPGFRPDAYPNEAYGRSIPPELHIKLGIYRLKAANRNLGEAMVCPTKVRTLRIDPSLCGALDPIRYP